MIESDYIKATNRVKVSMALTILRDVLPLKEYGVSEKDFSLVRRMLKDIEEILFCSYDIAEDNECSAEFNKGKGETSK